MHLKVTGVDTAELGMETVLMYWQPHLLALADPYLLIQGQIVAYLVVMALLRRGVRVRDMNSRLCSCLSVSTGVHLELALLVTQLGLVLVHFAIIRTRVDHPHVALLNHAQVLSLDAFEDLLLLLRGGAHVVGHVRGEVIGNDIGVLNDSTGVQLGLEQLLLG